MISTLDLCHCSAPRYNVLRSGPCQICRKPIQTKPFAEWIPEFAPWRHGGWYVTNLHYPSGAVGCVSRNYPDKKWRIACDPRPFEQQPTFRTRGDAARGERALIAEQAEAASAMRRSCGLCARIGTNDLSGPRAHSPGCPNDQPREVKP